MRPLGSCHEGPKKKGAACRPWYSLNAPSGFLPAWARQERGRVWAMGTYSLNALSGPLASMGDLSLHTALFALFSVYL